MRRVAQARSAWWWVPPRNCKYLWIGWFYATSDPDVWDSVVSALPVALPIPRN